MFEVNLQYTDFSNWAKHLVGAPDQMVMQLEQHNPSFIKDRFAARGWYERVGDLQLLPVLERADEAARALHNKGFQTRAEAEPVERRFKSELWR